MMKSLGLVSTFFVISITFCHFSPRNNMEKDSKKFAKIILIKYVNSTISRETKSKTPMLMIKGIRSKILILICK
jgi:hypothetical protein